MFKTSEFYFYMGSNRIFAFPIFIAISLWGTKNKVKKTEKQRLIRPVV